MKMVVNTVRVEQDVAYLEAGRSERLDLYRPTAAAGPRPVVIFIHGGAFHTGSKSLLSRISIYNGMGFGPVFKGRPLYRLYGGRAPKNWGRALRATTNSGQYRPIHN